MENPGKVMQFVKIYFAADLNSKANCNFDVVKFEQAVNGRMEMNLSAKG
jgi:hypothetical protein